jgi:hypothetical protein
MTERFYLVCHTAVLMKHQIVLLGISRTLNELLFICFISIVYLRNGLKLNHHVGQHFRKAAWIRKCFEWETAKMLVFSFHPKVKNAIGGNVVNFVLDPGINTPREQKF